LRDQERTVAEQAERTYERFVESWKSRRPKDGVRERLNPTRLE
jgi:transposase